MAGVPRFAFAVVGAAITACSLSVDLSGYTGGGGALDSADAAVDGARPPGDASSDASAPFVCTPDAGFAFCDDFDHGPIASVWTSISTKTGTISLASDGSVSPPNALLVTNPMVSAEGEGPYIQKDITGPFSTVSCRMLLRRDRIGSGAVAVGQLDMSIAGGGRLQLTPHMDASSGSFVLDRTAAGGATSTDQAAAPIAFPSTAFHEIALDYDGTTARVRADGAVAAELAGNVPGKIASFSIYLGFYADAASTPWTVRYDDVRCTTTP